MFRFNFSNSDESVNKNQDTKQISEPNKTKESLKIVGSKDQYSEIAENVKKAHLNIFISR